jgi:hypothetical protein
MGESKIYPGHIAPKNTKGVEHPWTKGIPEYDDLTVDEQVKYINQAEYLVKRGYLSSDLPISELARKLYKMKEAVNHKYKKLPE